MTHPRTLFWGLTAIFGLVSFVDSAYASWQHHETPRIIGGERTQTCAWPSTVSLNNCTGTLVHPKVILYAAHCGAHATQARFGEDSSSPDRVEKIEYCETYPGGGVRENDYAYCILKNAVDDIPIIPPLMGSDTQRISADTSAIAVGFGYYNQLRQYGLKHEVELRVHGFTGSEQAIVIAGGDGKDACQGDSGGPLFVELPDQRGYRVFGITSFGYEGSDPTKLACGYGGGWALIHHAMPWFEAQTGYDLTPCHDAYGNPDPDDRCGVAPLDPARAEGQWSSGCDWGALSDASQDLPPSIRWAPNVETQGYRPNERYEIELIVSDDGEVDHVELQVDGTSMDPIDMPPYTWTITVPDTERFELRAVAVDDAGQRSEAPPLTFGSVEDTDIAGFPTFPGDTPQDTGGSPGDLPEDRPQPALGAGSSCDLTPTPRGLEYYALALLGLCASRRRQGARGLAGRTANVSARRRAPRNVSRQQ